MKIFDISPDIFSARLYGSDTAPHLTAVSRMRDGAEYNLSDITMCLHTGAHIDSPLHFVENGVSVGEMDMDKFIGECHVASAKGPITAEWVERNMPWNCKKLLIKCGGNGYLMDNAVFEICRFNIDLVGIDALSVAHESNEGPVHRELMYNNIAILEGIDLENVDDGEYFLFAAPVKAKSAEAAPCRAVLIKGLTATD